MNNFDDIIEYIKFSATTFLNSNLFLFDLGLRQSIHTHSRSLFSLSLLAKRDLISEAVVIFMHYQMINLDSITNENNK